MGGEARMVNLSKDRLMTIHRHWIWANYIRIQFYREFGENTLELARDPVSYAISSVGTHMCLWYGLLFTVCEAIREDHVVVQDAEPFFSEIYEDLRRFRNAIFHVQTEYWSPKLFEIMERKDSPTKIKKVHEEIGKWLLAELQVGPNAGP